MVPMGSVDMFIESWAETFRNHSVNTAVTKRTEKSGRVVGVDGGSQVNRDPQCPSSSLHFLAIPCLPDGLRPQTL